MNIGRSLNDLTAQEYNFFFLFCSEAQEYNLVIMNQIGETGENLQAMKMIEL
jgi:hypothetical protein